MTIEKRKDKFVWIRKGEQLIRFAVSHIELYVTDFGNLITHVICDPTPGRGPIRPKYLVDKRRSRKAVSNVIWDDGSHNYKLVKRVVKKKIAKARSNAFIWDMIDGKMLRFAVSHTYTWNTVKNQKDTAIKFAICDIETGRDEIPEHSIPKHCASALVSASGGIWDDGTYKFEIKKSKA